MIGFGEAIARKNKVNEVLRLIHLIAVIFNIPNINKSEKVRVIFKIKSSQEQQFPHKEPGFLWPF